MPPSIDPAATAATQTSSGPLTAADRDLLIKVRQAGLWEMPVGEYAESQRAKEVGRQIMNEHAKLDLMTRQTAKKLGVALPGDMTYPESTGLVDHDQLPEPPTPSPATPRAVPVETGGQK
ncbi:hypothetical protein [Nonomuraea angiospora]